MIRGHCLHAFRWRHSYCSLLHCQAGSPQKPSPTHPLHTFSAIVCSVLEESTAENALPCHSRPPLLIALQATAVAGCSWPRDASLQQYSRSQTLPCRCLIAAPLHWVALPPTGSGPCPRPTWTAGGTGRPTGSTRWDWAEVNTGRLPASAVWVSCCICNSAGQHRPLTTSAVWLWLLLLAHSMQGGQKAVYLQNAPARCTADACHPHP